MKGGSQGNGFIITGCALRHTGWVARGPGGYFNNPVEPVWLLCTRTALYKATACLEGQEAKGKDQTIKMGPGGVLLVNFLRLLYTHTIDTKRKKDATNASCLEGDKAAKVMKKSGQCLAG